MIKGAQKRMIVVKTADSAIFEEVHFVMRRESSAERMDMLAEANKIIESCDCSKKRSRMRRARGALISLGVFLCGGVTGGVIAALFAVIF